MCSLSYFSKVIQCNVTKLSKLCGLTMADPDISQTFSKCLSKRVWKVSRLTQAFFKSARMCLKSSRFFSKDSRFVWHTAPLDLKPGSKWQQEQCLQPNRWGKWQRTSTINAKWRYSSQPPEDRRAKLAGWEWQYWFPTGHGLLSWTRKIRMCSSSTSQSVHPSPALLQTWPWTCRWNCDGAHCSSRCNTPSTSSTLP